MRWKAIEIIILAEIASRQQLRCQSFDFGDRSQYSHLGTGNLLRRQQFAKSHSQIMNLAALATEFLERQRLVISTVRSYESTMLPLLQQYGRWSIEIIYRRILATYVLY